MSPEATPEQVEMIRALCALCEHVLPVIGCENCCLLDDLGAAFGADVPPTVRRARALFAAGVTPEEPTPLYDRLRAECDVAEREAREITDEALADALREWGAGG